MQVDFVTSKNRQSLSAFKEQKITELDSACNTTILDVFTSTVGSTTYEFGFDYEDQQNLSGTLGMFNSGLVTSVEWTTKNAGRVTLNDAQFKQVVADGFIHKDTNIKKYHDKKALVDSALSIAEVESVVW